LLLVRLASIPIPRRSHAEAFAAADIPTFDDQNGVTMKGDGRSANAFACAN